jgi:hypothetical protein
MLLVEVPTGREPERRYVLDVILADRLGLEWTLRTAERRDVRITRADDPGGASVTLPDGLFATPSADWLTPASMPVVRMADGLPVLYEAPSPASDAEPGATMLEVDVLGGAFFMLTRYEELVIRERDGFGRFPAAASVAVRHGFLGTPVVDLYVDLLWDALQRTWPGLRRRETSYEVLLSHDVDDPLSTLEHGPREIVRQFAGDLARRRDPRMLARRARALLGDKASDPHNTFGFLMDVSERHGLRSAFYFLPYRDERPRDGGPYLFEDAWVRSLIGRVARRGHEVGLHPSFGTFRDATRTREELARLQRVAEAEGVRQEAWGGRQHYLRWANPVTWRNWEAAGLSYDASVGYADAVGFRTGTCHPYRVFDLEERRTLRLWERPFQVMDVTLLSTMGLTPAAARATVRDVAAACRRHRGCLGILWHNNTLLRSDREKRFYETLVADAVLER